MGFAGRKHIAQLAKKMGLASVTKDLYVTAGLSCENISFLRQGRPKVQSSILVAGSGRSGTTWVGNVVSASVPSIQQIFEPLHPTFSAHVRDLTGYDERDPYLRSFYLSHNAEDLAWQDYWRRVLSGQERSYWTDVERNTLFPNRFLIKEVRANLMLGYVARHFSPKIILLIRHPCAVIHSRLHKVAEKWIADVDDILIQDSLVEDYLSPWIDEIAKERDLVGSHAAWWAIENMVALRELEHHQYRVVFYEQLMTRPQREFLALLDYVDAPADTIDQTTIATPSRMATDALTSKQIRSQPGWKLDLSRDQQHRILDWAHRVGISFYSDEEMPRAVGQTVGIL